MNPPLPASPQVRLPVGYIRLTFDGTPPWLGCSLETHDPQLGQPPCGALRFSLWRRPVMH